MTNNLFFRCFKTQKACKQASSKEKNTLFASEQSAKYFLLSFEKVLKLYFFTYAKFLVDVLNIIFYRAFRKVKMHGDFLRTPITVIQERNTDFQRRKRIKIIVFLRLMKAIPTVIKLFYNSHNPVSFTKSSSKKQRPTVGLYSYYIHAI